MLLKEEMRRTLEFFKWKSASWVAKTSSSAFTNMELSPSPIVLKGLIAYAFRQADVFLSLHNHFLSLWRGLTVLDNSANQLPPIPAGIEDTMQGVDGGDI
jgi:hypothetical protein